MIQAQGRRFENDDEAPAPDFMPAYIAEFRFGRVLLHLFCACRDHQIKWHWRGIRREWAAERAKM